MVNLYVVKDSRGDYRTQLISMPNDEQIRRSIPFIAENDPLIQRYPEDFAIYRVGQFDYASGVVIPESAPVFICDMKVGE